MIEKILQKISHKFGAIALYLSGKITKIKTKQIVYSLLDDKIALTKAKYFIDKNLWSDALQVMFSVPNPSSDLQQAINKIKSHNFCQSPPESTPENSLRPKPAASR